MFDTIWNDPQALGQVIGAVIGVAGLIIGTFVTILTSFIIRQMDIRREERRSDAEQQKAKKEKQFALQQEIYSQFISELAAFENFLSKKGGDLSVKTLENFDNEWTRTEIKVDLVASERVRQLKDNLSKELMELASGKFSQKDSSKEVALSAEYTKDRSALLEAIRQDMEITS